MFSKLSELINKPRPMIRCTSCRKMVSRTADKCPKCGGVITPEDVAKADKNQVTVNKVGLGCGVTFAAFFLLMIIAGLAMPDQKSQEAKNQSAAMDTAREVIAAQAGTIAEDASSLFDVVGNGITPINLLTSKPEKTYWFRYAIRTDPRSLNPDDISRDIFKIICNAGLHLRATEALAGYQSLYFVFQCPDRTGTQKDCVEISIPANIFKASVNELQAITPKSVGDYIESHDLYRKNPDFQD